jgi:hypothetical protein
VRVHHLDAGTMHPPGPDVVCHVLLVEGPDGLVLVDTGFGLADVAAPARRLGRCATSCAPHSTPSRPRRARSSASVCVARTSATSS